MNHSQTKRINGEKTPIELFTGKKPNLHHLKVFGCSAYAYLPKELRKKFDEKAIKCIFIGYENFRYRLWDPIKK
jgi:hypothetical protein